LNIPVLEEIAHDRSYETITEFLKESTNNKSFYAVTTAHL